MNIRSFLEEIKSGGFVLPDGEYEAFLRANLGLIGHPDPFIRDDLAYEAYAAWIGQGRLGNDCLRWLLRELTGDRCLFSRIGSRSIRHVPRRTFSLLLVDCVLSFDARKPFLDAAAFQQVLDALEDYAEREALVIGYHKRYGWCHAVAHLADALGAAFRSPRAGDAERRRVLSVIARLVVGNAGVFQDQEEYRLVAAYMRPVDGGRAGSAELPSWHARALDAAAQAAEAAEAGYHEKFVLRKNVLQYFQTLYFFARKAGDAGLEALCWSILEARKAWK